MTKLTFTTGVAAIALGLAVATPAEAGTLETLERERAIYIESMLDPETTPEERLVKAGVSKRRLVDLFVRK